DDLSPLHQMAGAIPGADAHLFAPRPTIRWRAYRGHGNKPGPGREVAYRMVGSMGYAYRQVEAPTGEKKERLLDAGENPPNGVVVHYWLKDAPGELTLAFLDADGREQYTWGRRAHALLNRVHDAVVMLRDLRAQAEAWAARLDASPIKDPAGALAWTLSAIEDELIQVRSEDPRMFPAKLNTRLATVVTLIEYSDAAPTQALRELHENLALRTEMELAKLDRCVATDVPAFNALCRDAGVAAIV